MAAAKLRSKTKMRSTRSNRKKTSKILLFLQRRRALPFIILFAIIGSILVYMSFAASNTVSYEGQLSSSEPSRSYSVSAGANGVLTAAHNSKDSAMRISILNSAGSILASKTGTRASITTTVEPGTYSIKVDYTKTIKGVKKYRVTITYPVMEPNPPPVTDTTPPTALITSPTGDVVAGTVVFSATADDNVAVDRVDFLVDGTMVLSDVASPYTYSWNTTSVPNGSHTLSIKVYDTSGNFASASRPVTVSNTTTSPPTGTLIWKADGSRGLTDEWSAWSDDNLTSGEPASPGALYTGWTHPNMSLEQTLGGVLPGKKSYRVYAPAGETRHELKMAHPVRSGFEGHVFSEGQEVWISWATKMTLLTKQSTGWWMINQFRHVNESGLTTGGSPHGLGMRSNSTYQWTSDPAIYAGAATTLDTGIPIVVGKTVKWTFHVKWSSNQSIGFMEVFADDGSGWKTVVPKRMQATLLFNSSTGKSGKNHMRFGVYRADSLSSYPAESLMAGLNVASTRALAEYIAFGQ